MKKLIVILAVIVFFTVCALGFSPAPVSKYQIWGCDNIIFRCNTCTGEVTMKTFDRLAGVGKEHVVWAGQTDYTK